MRKTVRTTAAMALTIGLMLGACSEDDVDSAAERAGEVADRAEDRAQDAFATFRTGFERSVDEASSGDNEAHEKLLDECRDALEEMRKNEDPRAERMGALCQQIRDADDGNAWQEVREEYEEIRNSQ